MMQLYRDINAALVANNWLECERFLDRLGAGSQYIRGELIPGAEIVGTLRLLGVERHRFATWNQVLRWAHEEFVARGEDADAILHGLRENE